MTAAIGVHVAVPDRPEKVWHVLAPLISAPGRRSMRLYNPQTGKFSDTADLTKTLPARPAALYPFTRKGLRTGLLYLDFDDKRGGRAAVDADLATATEWITRCGGKVVTDHSPSGAHLLCPLAIGTTASFAELKNLVRLLAARLPTLDSNPNTTDPQYACLSAPGTPAKHGGYRQLDGTLTEAVEAFTNRSEPSLLPRLYELLGAVTPRPADTTDRDASTDSTDISAYCTGTGAEQRLAPEYVRHDPMDPELIDFAVHGVMATGQRHWDSASEARMAVICAAISRGHSRASIAELIAPGGPWQHGLGAAFARYQHRAGNALDHDFVKALTWLCTNTFKYRPPQHKRKNTPGGTRGNQPNLGPWGPADLRRWLSAAMEWTDYEFSGKRYRWTVHAVLQTLAWHALVAGQLINGVWVVGVGGRNLALGTGLLSSDTVWRVLRDLRDRPGAPLILTRPAVNTEADYYALTTPHGITSDPAGAERVRIEPVHDAWWVAGHHLRRIYELIAHYGLTNRADILAAARVSRTAGDETLIALEILGLITRTGRGTVGPGKATPDSLAAAHDTDSVRQDRLARYRAQRDQWQAWLDGRDQARVDVIMDKISHAMPAEDPDAERTFWAAALANGPPGDNDIDTDREAIDLVANVLGGRIVAAAGPPL